MNIGFMFAECKLINVQAELEEHVLENAIDYTLPCFITMISWMLQFLKYNDLLLLAVFSI
jgi:hypothetical protein